jgi:class 3 adenylate cyclase
VPSFLVKEGPLGGGRLEVESQVVLGRGAADVVIDDPEISRRHALVRVTGDLIEIDDLDSLNGTWVNGQRIATTTRLRRGDVVRLGSSVLEVELEPAQTPAVDEPTAPVVQLRQPPLAAGRCPECDAEVPSSARFCSYCGVPLQTTPAPAVAALDGRKLAAAPEADADELRPVTALFADIVGSTALGERLGPHEVKALIGECVSHMSRAVEQFGGWVQSYGGDGIAAFFGLPTAHEDDQDRAAHAALQILAVVGEYARDIAAAWGVDDFNVRVGVNSGHMAVGLVGAADRQLVALGDATNVAARLQAAAAPGAVVVGEPTARRLAHRFLLEALGEVQVKGREEPVLAWRLAGPLGETIRQAPTPLIGRDPEVARLRVAVEELLVGRGQLLVLTGDSGIGKTRLLGELATIAGNRALWLEGQTRSFGSELLYGPFVAILRSWLGAEPGEAEVSVRTKLRSKLTSLPSLDLEPAVSKLGTLIGLRADAELAAPSLEDLGADIRVAYCEWVAALGARQPIVIAIDDFQWADSPTRELAEALLDLTDRAPLLLGVAFRGQPASEASRFRLHALEHFPHRTTDLSLDPLEAGNANDLLAMLLPDGLDPAAGAEVVAQAEGNPLYLEELLRALIDEGGLERRRRTWALTRTPARQLPAALEGLLLARIDQLPGGARRLAQMAAVVGRSFPARVLAQVAQSDAIEPEISTLLRAQVITELRRFPELVYGFKHGLVQQCALSTLTPTRRDELYGAVAAVFEELYSGARDEYLDVLASYYARSSNRAKALEYLELAGRRAGSLNATAEAATLLRRARKVAAELGDAPAERRLTDELEQLATVGARVP